VLSDHAGAIARGFGCGGHVHDMALAARGEQGRVWRLTTDRGIHAVKELIIRQEPADVEMDVAFQEAVLAAGSVTMPRPIRTVGGDVLLEVAGHQVRAYTWVDLLPTDLTLDSASIGATLAAVHRVRHLPARPPHPWYSDPVGAARWADLLTAAAAARAPFAEAFRAEVPHLLALESVLEAPSRLQNCHRDLWADNMLPTPDGRICVIDWENCGLADPSQEVPMALVDFGGDDQSRIAALYGAYLDNGGPGRVSGPGAFTMVIAQFGHFWESAVRTYAAPQATDEQQAHSVDRVAELLDRPLRPHHIEEMLDTLSGTAASGGSGRAPGIPAKPSAPTRSVRGSARDRRAHRGPGRGGQ
jgi:Ser/Thr protein kinase RdoA (MazF antagonist)